MPFMMFCLVIRDRDGKLLDTHDIDADTILTRGDVRALKRAYPNLGMIERVTTVERRPQ